MATTFSKDDFRRIRLNLAAMLVMIALGAAAVYASQQLLQAGSKSQQAAQARLQEHRSRLDRARDEEQELKQKIARYNQLAARGYFEQEQRLDWIELIQGIKSNRRLIGLEYEIAPQQPVDANLLLVAGSAVGKHEFLASPMNLRLKLLHEGDLLAFLDDLNASARAYLRVRKCDVERLPKSTGDNAAVPPQLGAECTIDWITIRERKGA